MDGHADLYPISLSVSSLIHVKMFNLTFLFDVVLSLYRHVIFHGCIIGKYYPGTKLSTNINLRKYISKRLTGIRRRTSLELLYNG